MEQILVKMLDYGPTTGALVFLGYLLLQNQKSSQKWSDTIAANTEATRTQTEVLKEIMEAIRESKTINAQVLHAIDGCAKKNFRT